MGKTTIKGTNLSVWLVAGLFSLAGLIIVWALKALGWIGKHIGMWSITHARTTLGIGVLSGAVLLIGWQYVLGLVAVALLTGSIWKAAHRESFERTLGAWLRTWHRKWWTYRRRWADTFTRCGLVLEVNGEQHLPKLKKVRTTPYWDRLAIKMQVGQEMADYEAVSGKLRSAFEGERLTVRELEPRVIAVDVMRRDPFRHEVIPATAMPAATADIDFAAIPVGLTEHLEPLTLSMVGGHTAGAGTTGSGKAGLEWNVLRGLAPALADGTVKPVFIDPKARELRQGLALIEVGTYGTPTPELNTRGRRLDSDDRMPEPTGDYALTEWDTVCLLERIAREVHEANLTGGGLGERDFVPSQRTPLRPIFIDELAPLLHYWSRGALDRIESALGIILTQGRAAGFIVLGLIQEPTKDIFTQRDLFQRRIGLRLPTEAHTDAALTDNAADRGAECSRIPESLPGVLYSFHEDDSRAQRGRLGHVTNDHIAELVEYVQALRSVTSITPPAVEPELEYEYIEVA